MNKRYRPKKDPAWNLKDFNLLRIITTEKEYKEEQDKIVMLSWHLVDIPLPSIMRSRMKKIANVKALIV